MGISTPLNVQINPLSKSLITNQTHQNSPKQPKSNIPTKKHQLGNLYFNNLRKSFDLSADLEKSILYD